MEPWITLTDVSRIRHCLKSAYLEKEGKHENEDKALGMNLKKGADFPSPKFPAVCVGVIP